MPKRTRLVSARAKTKRPTRYLSGSRGGYGRKSSYKRGKR